MPPRALRQVDDPPTRSDEAELVRSAAAGVRSAFDTLYRIHAPVVFALLTRLIGPDREREDLLQETFVRFHRSLGRFRGECSVRTFLYQITTRVAIDYLRRRGPVHIQDLELENQIDVAATPAEVMQRRQELVRALELLGCVRPKQRVAFVLHEVMGMTHEEVARIMGLRAPAVRMRVNAAKRTLSKLTKDQR